MLKKLRQLKLKLSNILKIYKLSLETKYYGFCYILLIIISLLFSYIIHYFIEPERINISVYKELLVNTGIALIGFTGIIFTLQIFNQEVKNNYTNSIMEKLLDIKFQHIIQYIYISLITYIFIFLPNTDMFEKNISFLIPFYYLTIIILFIMFGIDLFVSTNKSNKFVIIKIIEKRIDYILNLVEKEYISFEKYCNKEKEYNPPLIDYIEKANQLFIVYIQCINSILRNSIDDPILFSNGMETYVNVVKNRLAKRKNTFNYNYIPFLSEVLPNKDNDSFIEKYICEYLDEYSQIALKNKNRDILSIIQQTYHSMLLIGKDNRYINNNGLELTIKVIFAYYLKTIKYIVEFNNENLLFETIEIFKDLFVKNGKYFNELIDIMFIDDINEISKLSLEKESLMNFRNTQGLIVIPFYSVLNSNDDNKDYRLKLLFDSLKNNLVDFTTKKNLIKRKDESRTYLHYTFNTAEPFSYHRCLIEYYNSQIKDGKFTNNTFFDNDLLKPFVNFFYDDVVINCLIILDNDNRFVTGFVDAEQNVLLLSELLIKTIVNEDFKKIKKDNLSLLKKCFKSIEKFSKRHDDNSMRCYDVNNFFKELFYKFSQLIVDNKEINNLFFNEYQNTIKNCLEINDTKKVKFDYFYEYINSCLNCTYDKDNINNLVEWYIHIKNNPLYELYKIFTELSNKLFYNTDELSYENCETLKSLILDKFETYLKSSKNNDINNFIDEAKIDIIKSKNKNDKINLIIKKIKR